MNSPANNHPEPEENAEQYLARRFPELKRTRSTPTLISINGIGSRFVGKREFDPETQSHVTTRVLTFVFIPFLALSAWRIIPAGGSRYSLLGKVPLSSFAKRANWLFLACVLFLIAYGKWSAYVHSPAYLSEKSMDSAAESMKAGRTLDAMKDYYTVITKEWPNATEAKTHYGEAFEASLRSGVLETGVQAVQQARQAAVGPYRLLKDAPARILAWAKTAKDESMAAEIMKTALPSVPETEKAAFESQRLTLLEKINKLHPENAAVAIDLAYIYDESDRTDDCRKLLEPNVTKLADTEGARILGRIYVREGKHQEGAELLRAYSRARLKAYHDAEAGVESLYKKLSDSAVKTLKQGKAPASFYNAYDDANEAEQSKLVQNYIGGVVKNSSAMTQAQENLADSARIVPVMLDLGIASLRVGQGQADQSLRKKFLEEAESAFLSIQGSAGQTNEYRLFLGQVFYWLGKHKEGKELFDKLLDETKGSEVGLMVSESLRQVGDIEEARRVCESMYESAPSQTLKAQAAGQRATMWKNIDDRIVWLERCGQGSPAVEANLNEARGQKKIEEGKPKEGEVLLRNALAGYDKLPRDATSLNNTANILNTLYGVTHDPADFKESLNRHEEAARLVPDDTIILSNLAQGCLVQAWLEVAAEQADLKTLPAGIESFLVASLQHNLEEEDKQSAKLADSDSMKKAREIFEKLMVLAPKSAEHCRSLQRVHSICRRTDELKKVLVHASAANFDTTEGWEESRKQWKENHDAETLISLEERINVVSKAIQDSPPTATPNIKVALKGTLLLSKLSLSNLTGKGEAADFLSEAEVMLKMSDSAASVGTAEGCILRAAVLQISKETAFREFVTSNRKIFDDGALLALAVQKGIALDAIKSSQAMKRWVILREQVAKAWPTSRRLTEWAILKLMAPELAEDCGQTILKNERLLTNAQLDQLLSPYDPETLFEGLLLHHLKGDSDGKQEWESAKQKGMPIPSI